MKIVGLEGLSTGELNSELQRGAKFVSFPYCMSCIVLTFKRFSDIHFVRAGESPLAKGLAFTAISLLLGWWGLPWGPIYTVQSVVTNLRGGKDLTREVVAALNQPAPAPAPAGPPAPHS